MRKPKVGALGRRRVSFDSVDMFVCLIIQQMRTICLSFMCVPLRSRNVPSFVYVCVWPELHRVYKSLYISLIFYK